MGYVSSLEGNPFTNHLLSSMAIQAPKNTHRFLPKPGNHRGSTPGRHGHVMRCLVHLATKKIPLERWTKREPGCLRFDRMSRASGRCVFRGGAFKLIWNFRGVNCVTYFILGSNHPSHMGVSKNSGLSPQIIHFNRVFHYIHHPFWGFSTYFWKHPYRGWSTTQVYWGL